MAAAKLPRIAVERAASASIGKDTVPAMQSGIFWGYVGLIEGLVGAHQGRVRRPMTVIATGGLAPLFAKATAGHRAPSTPTSPCAAWSRSTAATGAPAHEPTPSRRRADELLFLPLGRGGRDRHEPQSLRLCRQVADGRSRRHLRRRRARRASTSSCPTSASSRSAADDLVGLVLTHAHEDHIGAVPYLWPRLRCPIYATPFTAALLRAQAARGRPRRRGRRSRRSRCPAASSSAPFELELITLTHSIPEPNAVVIRTPAGTRAAHRRLEARSRRRWSAR